jgi:adenine-specific DNA-methyltransferase
MGDQTGISKSVDWKGGGDFIYVELAKWNEEAKEKILKAKSLSELEKLFDELYERYFLNYNVKTKEFKKKIIKEEGFKKLSLNEQKKLFVEMLDMNQMYVNFSERADKKYNLSKEDIALSEEFYNAKK